MSAVSLSCHETKDGQKPTSSRQNFFFATHVSIQLMTTNPLTIEHRVNDWLTLPQSILSVKAVRDETPIRKRMNAMTMGTRWVIRPKALL
nr:hypothetical protein I308_03388 [Cryptococcus tetragattii IND107]